MIYYLHERINKSVYVYTYRIYLFLYTIAERYVHGECREDRKPPRPERPERALILGCFSFEIVCVQYADNRTRSKQ